MKEQRKMYSLVLSWGCNEEQLLDGRCKTLAERSTKLAVIPCLHTLSSFKTYECDNKFSIDVMAMTLYWIWEGVATLVWGWKQEREGSKEKHRGMFQKVKWREMKPHVKIKMFFLSHSRPLPSLPQVSCIDTEASSESHKPRVKQHDYFPPSFPFSRH